MTTSHTGADRRELPDGTVTFLFSDIEGSTRLLHELGEAAYADALARHRRILRDAFVRYGGVDATEAWRHRSGVALESWLAKMNDETMTRLRSGLRDDAFEQAWQRGTLLAVEEVVEMALAARLSVD